MNTPQKEKNWNKSPFILRVIGLGSPYFVKTPWWLKKFYSSYIWDIQTDEKVIYLTFDDGPNEQVTSFVLDELKRYNAKASFFCIGQNVVDHPEIYNRILEEGHQVGNHTFDHLNGWETKTKVYLENVIKAANHIDSALFRPPYGRMTSFQAKNISKALKKEQARIIMWSVLSADFDMDISNEQCLQHVILNTSKGSIIVFHDSKKAFSKLQYVLPVILRYFAEKGFRFESLNEKTIEQNSRKLQIAEKGHI